MSGAKGKASGWSKMRELQLWEGKTQDLSLLKTMCVYVTFMRSVCSTMHIIMIMYTQYV